MIQVRLIRLETNPEYGTFGVLIFNGEVFCVTLEPYSRNNQVSISNIPAQQYICRRFNSFSFGETFEVTGVQDRSQILFHKGNFAVNTKGCIILAESFGKIKGDRAVLNSGKTFELFMLKLVGIESFLLTIKESY